MTTSEDDIIAYFKQQSDLNAGDFPIGIGDDMAEIKLPGGDSVFITTDMLLDGVHFDSKSATYEQIGYKAMAVSLSDCAAMATKPLAAVVAVALTKNFSVEYLKQAHSGIIRAGSLYNCPLIGGDITTWNDKSRFAINTTMLSINAGVKPVTRSGARINDIICVTGSLGGSLLSKHLSFEPRIDQAIKIAQLVKINSMIDISDGLATDLSRICKQSSVGAILDASSIPLAEDAKKTNNPLGSALNDGEDFELLFTLSEEHYQKLIQSWDDSIPITKIGTIIKSDKIKINNVDGSVSDLQPAGYDHIRKLNDNNS